jgi:hypothetical protein
VAKEAAKGRVRYRPKQVLARYLNPSPLETPPILAKFSYLPDQDFTGRAKLLRLPYRGCWSELKQGAVLF